MGKFFAMLPAFFGTSGFELFTINCLQPQSSYLLLAFKIVIVPVELSNKAQQSVTTTSYYVESVRFLAKKKRLHFRSGHR